MLNALDLIEDAGGYWHRATSGAAATLEKWNAKDLN
jgi:hypothetical protein